MSGTDAELPRPMFAACRLPPRQPTALLPRSKTDARKGGCSRGVGVQFNYGVPCSLGFRSSCGKDQE
eukprot:4749431-Pyramimonas_sp.AAC.1